MKFIYLIYGNLIRFLGKIGIFIYFSKTYKKNEIDFNDLKLTKYRNKLIQYGGLYDGSYFIPNLEYNIVFSPGVSDTVFFEKELLKKGATIFMADFSVDDPNIGTNAFFEKKYISTIIKDRNHISLEDWINSNKKKFPIEIKHTILQCDIEGMEYEVILNTPSEIFNFFSVIVVEFHKFNLIENKLLSSLVISAFKKLRKTHLPIHININNNNNKIISTVEYTFIRKDLFLEEELVSANIIPTRNIEKKKLIEVPKFFLE